MTGIIIGFDGARYDTIAIMAYTPTKNRTRHTEYDFMVSASILGVGSVVLWLGDLGTCSHMCSIIDNVKVNGGLVDLRKVFDKHQEIERQYNETINLESVWKNKNAEEDSKYGYGDMR